MYRLRELQRDDLPTVNEWRNNPDLIALLGAPYRYINCEVDDRWFDVYMNNRAKEVRCTVTDENGDVLGLISLTGIDSLNQTAELHIMLAPEHQNKGAGSFAVKEMLSHAFRNLNLRRIELSVLNDNARAKHVYEKLGFQIEGVKKQAVYKNGKFKDMAFYAILKDDWQNRGGVLTDFIALFSGIFGGRCAA